MAKQVNNKKHKAVLEYSPDDPEIQAIIDKYPKKSLNPFANKKNKELMEEEINSLLKAREKARREEEKRLREEKRKAEQKLIEEQRKIQKELQKERIVNFFNKYRIVISAVALLLVGTVVGKIAIDKYNATIRKVSFTFQDEEKYVGDFVDFSYVVEPSTAIFKDNDIQISVNDESLIETEGDATKCSREGTLIAKIIYKNKEMDSKTISIKPVLINKLYIADFELGRGNSIKLNPTIEPQNATNKSYIATVSDNDIASIKDNTITGLSVGETALHLKSTDGFSYDVKVNVVEIEPTAIKIDGLSDKYIVGDKDKINIVFEPSDATLKDYTLSSSNTNVIAVDEDGQLNVKAKGSAVITAYHNELIIDSKEVTVDYPDPQYITVSDDDFSLSVGQTKQLHATIDPNPVSDNTIIWESSDNDIATVSRNGVVSAIASGNVSIYARTSNGISDSVNITIREVTRNTSSAATTVTSEGGTRSNVSRNTETVIVPTQSESSSTSVWVPTNGGTKYHSNQYCSKMKDPIQVSLETAIANGYTACKKCY